MNNPHPASYEYVVESLRNVVFGDGVDDQMIIRDAVAALGDVPQPRRGHLADAHRSYELLRAAVAALGGSARAIAADHHRLSALFEWSAISSPVMTAVLSGHFNLTIGALERLGDPDSPYQKACLAELDDASAVGVFLLTELAYGSRAIDLQTHAMWQPDTRTFRIHTSGPDAIKLMPNLADPHTPKTTIIIARLVADGVDQGVWPFLARLRTRAGIADGVHITALPETAGIPMDHALIRFDGLDLPEDAWLHGNLASLDPDGRFAGDLPPRQRFEATIGGLQSGRICLAGAAAAAARAALGLTVHYAAQRLTAGDVPVLRRGAAQRDLISATASAYALSVFARNAHTAFARDQDATNRALTAMLTKPLLANTAQGIIETCRQRCGAQGLVRVNYLADYLAGAAAIITAEGENQTLQIAVGRLLRRHEPPASLQPLPSHDRPWWHTILDERIHLLLDPADGRGDITAIHLADAVAEQLAAAHLAAAADSITDPHIHTLVSALADVYALERVRADAAWFTAHYILPPVRAAELDAELARRHHQLARHLPAVTEAFALPPLPAPIYGPDYISAYLDITGWHHQFTPSAAGIAR